jgi:hypothetical protein
VEKELDMGFTVEEIAAGLERLLQRLGGDGTPQRIGNTLRFQAPDGPTVEVSPMPEERIRYPILFPRTLVVLRGEAAAVASLYEQILYAFWRVGG